MSLRPRKPAARAAPSWNNGSLFAKAIDFKEPFQASQPVGVTLLGEGKPNAKFLIKFYYGPISDDPDVHVSIPALTGDSIYLRVRINMVVGKTEQTRFGNTIMQKLQTRLSASGFYEPIAGKAVHVCGNAPASYYAGFLVQEQDAPPYAVNFRELAEAASGVAASVAFQVDDHMYTYEMRNVNDSTAEMWATRTT